MKKCKLLLLQMAPQSLVKKLKKKSNWLFLRRLYRLGSSASKASRLKALNSGNKAQREFLVEMLHHAVTGQIPIKSSHRAVINKSGKKKFLYEHFSDVSDLLNSSDNRQKEVLVQVNNYHVLLHHVFHQHHD